MTSNNQSEAVILLLLNCWCLGQTGIEVDL